MMLIDAIDDEWRAQQRLQAVQAGEQVREMNAVPQEGRHAQNQRETMIVTHVLLPSCT